MRKILLFAFFAFVFCTSAAFALEPIVQVSISVYPSQIVPGNEGYLQLTFKNTGNDFADRIKISRVSFDPYIMPSGNWIVEVGGLGVGESTTTLLKFYVSSSAPSGLYTMRFDIDYCRDSSCRTINQNAIITVRSPSQLEVSSVEPTLFMPGEKTNLTFRLTNKGKNAVDNLVLTWSSPENAILPLGSENRIIVSRIEAGSSYEARVAVMANPAVAPGVYPLSISLGYSDKSGDNQTVSSIVGIEISAETDFDVSVQEITQSLTTFTVTNIGTATAYSTILSIPRQKDFRVIGTSTAVIGNLNAGDYTLASFQIVPIGNSTEPRSLTVEISYTDASGVRRVVEKQVEMVSGFAISQIRSSPRTQGQFQISGNGILYIAIGAIGIICVIAFLKFGKWMRKKR